MQRINPMGWARVPAEKAFGSKEPVSTSNMMEAVCKTLNELFIQQMGMAQAIQFQQDPETGTAIVTVVMHDEADNTAGRFDNISVRFAKE